MFVSDLSDSFLRASAMSVNSGKSKVTCVKSARKSRLSLISDKDDNFEKELLICLQYSHNLLFSRITHKLDTQGKT
ncbi:MAG: hypothetical protein EBX92_09375 [Actinobacteria bacterium]|nr:hypothetical protein [Actinomycetota bacterium]